MHYKNIKMSFWFALFIITFLRMMQFFNCLDPITGFIKPDYKFLGFGILVSILVITVVVMCLSFTIKRCPVKVPRLTKVSGAISLILALCILYSLTRLGYSASVPYWQPLILKITGALAAVFFGALFVKSLKDFPIPAICFVAPALYFLAKLIYVFTATSVIALISDNVLYLATCIFTLLFMFEFCVAKIQTEESNVYKKIAITGFPAVLLSISTSIPQILAWYFKTEAADRVILADAVTMFITGCFIYAFLCRYFSGRNLKSRKSNQKPSDSNTLSVNDFYTG